MWAMFMARNTPEPYPDGAYSSEGQPDVKGGMR